MNRNVLKIIAVITMIIDHVGLFLLNNNLICRCIGRLAFPLFAFFIAEGMRYTRNRKKYAFNLFTFALITQIPFGLLFNWKYLNVLFTFLIAIAVIVLIELYKKETKMPSILKNLSITMALMVIFIYLILCELFTWIDYGFFGVLLVVCFYFVKSKLRLLLGLLLIVLYTIKCAAIEGYNVISFFRLCAIISILLLFFYNNQKGGLNLKYLFYVAYPANFLIIYLIMLL